MKQTILVAVTALIALFSSCSHASSVVNKIVENSTNKTVSSSPSSPMITENIEAGTITGIETSLSLKVDYIQSKETKVTVVTPEDLAEYIKIEMRGTTLVCKVVSNVQIKQGIDRVKITVTAPAVTNFQATTSGTIDIANGMQLKNAAVKLGVTTSGSISVSAISCGSLNCDATTSGVISANNIKIDGAADAISTTSSSINISGSAKWVNLNASTSGTVNAGQLKAPKGTATATTSGSIYCNIKQLQIETSTSGTVNSVDSCTVKTKE